MPCILKRLPVTIPATGSAKIFYLFHCPLDGEQFTTGYDLTFFFFGISVSYGIVIDDDLNYAIQASYSAPTYTDPESYHVGLFDIGIFGALQLTDDDTVYDLEGTGCYGGFSAGAGPSFGVDMVYSGVEVFNDEQADALPNGVSVSVGAGVGLDAHFKQTKTYTLKSGKIFNQAKPYISKPGKTNNQTKLYTPKSGKTNWKRRLF